MSNKTKIQITSIYCTAPSEDGPFNDHDEVHIICQADASGVIRYPAKEDKPYSMAAGDTWDLTDAPLTLNFDYDVLVTLWDTDLSYDPTLGTYLVSNDYTPGNVLSSVRIQNPNGADYTLSAKVIPNQS